MRLAAAAVTLLFTLGGFDQLKTPVLPMPGDAAASAEEIADRLRGRVDDHVDRSSEDMGIIYAPFALSLDAPLLHWCRPEQEPGVEARLPPEGVPAYTGRLHAGEVARPLEARFWITSPARASRSVAAARRGAEQCDDRPDYALSDVADFDRWGWRGMQALVTTDNWSEDGDSGARATIVAARGALLAEVSWEWEFEAGGVPGRPPLFQGAEVAASVLAAVGGDPTGPAPSGATSAASTAMAAALPPPSVYGENMTPWPSAEDVSHDWVCSWAFNENVYGGAPTVTRRLIGEVSVREDVLFLPDEQSAEQARVRPLLWAGPDRGGGRSCELDEASSYSVGRRLESFVKGSWVGEIETLAIRRQGEPRSIGRDSVAHVALAVQHGSTMVYLRWQGPAGTDPAAALREGRAALTHTLDLLPTTGG
ncbi:hypothetical protein [Streptosporangium carneum]|uniref:Uncharacterized protein n=1 Tax=Streptosporangium carneum TaxID=47481 RepID=A0A9W6HZM2_9ACTN|nr:hypothetical protein [Streptosporangium carneum]GLK09241.1 hypothetical protein GCM10017600_26470 [Streptosporangium carneum]